MDATLLSRVTQLLDEIRGNINPERGYASELEREVADTFAALRVEAERHKSAAAASDFARIERAADSAQVLFLKSTDDDGRPCLVQTTESGGATLSLNIAFSDDDAGWASLDRAFAAAGPAQANAVRQAAARLLNDPAQDQSSEPKGPRP